MQRPHRFLAISVAALVLLLSACGGGGSASGNLTHLRLQLQWVPQAQFAGYFAAVRQNYYRDEGLDIELVPGGPDVVAAGRGLEAERPRVRDLVDPQGPPGARERSRFGPRQHRPDLPARRHARRCRGRTATSPRPPTSRGKKVGAWGFGNELEVIASAAAASRRPTSQAVTQPST